jgi:hypothetical protein
MTLFHIHRSGPFGSRGLHYSTARATRAIAAALKTMHRAIVAAKLRRLQNELMLHRSARATAEFDVAQFPQRPLMLGDKWDF